MFWVTVQRVTKCYYWQTNVVSVLVHELILRCGWSVLVALVHLGCEINCCEVVCSELSTKKTCKNLMVINKLFSFSAKIFFFIHSCLQTCIHVAFWIFFPLHVDQGETAPANMHSYSAWAHRGMYTLSHMYSTHWVTILSIY